MPKSKAEKDAEWAELYQEYKDNKAMDLVHSVKKINKEADEFENRLKALEQASNEGS